MFGALHSIEVALWVPKNPKAVMANSLHAYREAVMMKVHMQHREDQPAYIPSLHAIEADLPFEADCY